MFEATALEGNRRVIICIADFLDDCIRDAERELALHPEWSRPSIHETKDKLIKLRGKWTRVDADKL
jgi:hypothetical protein